MVTGPAGAGGGRDKGEAEQVLLDKALKDYHCLFTPWRLWAMDRNFPGVPRIKAMLATGTHVLIRVKDGITLRRMGDFLPDGSYLAEISGTGATLTVRVIEYQVSIAGRDAPELFCLITDLLEHAAYPAAVLARAYHWRWIGSETCLKEAKSAISGAGPSTGPILRSQTPALAAQEHAAWVTAVEWPAPPPVPPRKSPSRPAGDDAPDSPSSPPDLLHRRPPRRHRLRPDGRGHCQPARPADHREPRPDPAGLARRRITVDRNRHRDRKTKARRVPRRGPCLPTRTAVAEISVCGTLAA